MRRLLYLLIFCICSSHCDVFKNVAKKTVLPPIFEDGKAKISATCERQLKIYNESLMAHEEWALRMHDASVNSLPTGILDGNLYDLGSFDECINVNHRKSNVTILGKYCLGEVSTDFAQDDYFSKKNRTQSDGTEYKLKIAKCFPSGCTAKEMESIYQESIIFEAKTCQTKQDTIQLNGGAIATISLFGVILSLMVVCTAYDVTVYYLKKKTWHPIVTSFSLLTNGRHLLKTDRSSNEISCLDGIKAISCFWIVILHRYSIQLQFPVRNSFDHFKWMKDKDVVFNNSMAIVVDTFLLISGLLISYNFLISNAKSRKFNLLMFYIHRYIRLTPALVAVMLFVMYLMKDIASGPLWDNQIQSALVNGCEVHWWKLLLYVQNIFGRGLPMCIPHTWYLSLDMQLFLVAPFLIVPLARWPRLTLLVISSLTVLSIITCFLLGWFYELNAYMNGNIGFDQQMEYTWLYYFPIHTRAAPWLIGLVLGYVIFELKAKRMRPIKNRLIIFIIWLNALVILGLCVFGGRHLATGKPNRLANSFHLALVRPVWAISVGWIIYACVIGRGGPVNWFLSLSAFHVLSKLTYTLYIVHYPVLFFITFRMRVVPIFNSFETMYMFCGDVISSLLVSLILTIGVEFPFAAIDKVLFGKQKTER